MGRRFRWLALILAMAQAASAAPESSPPPDYRPPETRDLCPALAEDYELCSDDAYSGNCGDFVTAAGRLGEIYRSELSAHPGWVTGLQTDIWWGCGTADLGQLRSLLERIGTPRARAVLGQEPFRSLAEPRAPAPRPTADPEPDCEDPETPAERDACAAQNLKRAKAEHQRVYAACVEKVAPALRQELVSAHTSWENLLPIECEGAPFERDECLAQAYAERTQSLASLHPECAADPG